MPAKWQTVDAINDADIIALFVELSQVTAINRTILAIIQITLQAEAKYFVNIHPCGCALARAQTWGSRVRSGFA